MKCPAIAASLLGVFALTHNTETHATCLAGGDGFLRARLGGALDLNLHWNNSDLECEGSLRPDGSGVRLSFAGPQRSDGRRTRLVFGIAGVREGQAAQRLPTNVTLIFEGESRLFTTRGDSRCTVDQLKQQRIGSLGGTQRSYRIEGRGFCTEPATDLKNQQRILLSRFDFAGQTTFEDGTADFADYPNVAVEISRGTSRQRFNAWLADTSARQTQGLMFVKKMPADRGMLFLQSQPREMSMWMKNTFIPLDMLFIGPNRRIINIAANTEPHSLKTLSSQGPVIAVLELNGGETARRDIRVGDEVRWNQVSR